MTKFELEALQIRCKKCLNKWEHDEFMEIFGEFYLLVKEHKLKVNEKEFDEKEMECVKYNRDVWIERWGELDMNVRNEGEVILLNYIIEVLELNIKGEVLYYFNKSKEDFKLLSKALWTALSIWL